MENEQLVTPPPPIISEHKNGIAIPMLLIATALGALGDWLLRSTPWGIGATVWFLFLIVGVIVAQRVTESKTSIGFKLLLALSATFALLLSLRDSSTLRGINVGFAIAGFALATNYALNGCLQKVSIVQIVLDLTHAAAAAVGGTVRLMGADINWRVLSTSTTRHRVVGISRGVLIAMVFLAIFGTLFAQSDAVFSNFFREWSRFLPDDFGTHFLVFIGIAYAVGGMFRRSFIAPVMESGVAKFPNAPRAVVEVITLLTLVNLLFLMFAGVQFAYLFGGQQIVLSQVGLTAAEYARSGFFELLAVACISLPLLLFTHWIVGDEVPVWRNAYRALAGMHVLLLFVVIASALYRMQQYCNAFGLTELRFYSTITMIAIGLALILFAVTVLTGRRNLFAVGLLSLCATTALGLNFVNPDAWIANANFSHHQRTDGFDANYVLSLSTDAWPVLAARRSELSASDQEIIKNHIRLREIKPDTWQSWNLSRANAGRVSAQTTNEPNLTGTAN